MILKCVLLLLIRYMFNVKVYYSYVWFFVKIIDIWDYVVVVVYFYC